MSQLNLLVNTLKQVRFRSPLTSPINITGLNRRQDNVFNDMTQFNKNKIQKSNQHNKTPTIDNKQHHTYNTNTINVIPSHNHTTHTPIAPITHDIYIIALCLFISVFIILNSTAYPTISGGDTGELAVVIYKLSVAHPPGYPLFTMLGHLFTLLPGMLGSVAYRIVLMNLLLSSMTCSVMFILCYKYNVLFVKRLDLAYNSLQYIVWCVLGSVMYTFSTTVWLYTIQVEVFPLNNILCCLLLYTTLIYYQYESIAVQYAIQLQSVKKYDVAPSITVKDIQYIHTILIRLSYLGSFLCGLAATNQHTTVFYIVPIVLFILYNLYQHQLINGKLILQLIGCLLLGMSPYIYLPIRSGYKPIGSWGNQTTISGFFTHLLRSEYGTFQLAATDIGQNISLNHKLLFYCNNARNEFMLITLCLSLIGIINSLLHHRSYQQHITIVYMTCYAVYIIVFHQLANLDDRPLFLGVQARFWQQPNMIICMYCSTGLISMIQFAVYIIQLHTTQNVINAVKQIMTCLPVALSLVQILRNYKSLDHSHTDYLYLYGSNQLHTFPNNSLVLLNGDINNNLMSYVQLCEHIRTDIQLIGLQQMSWPWYTQQHQTNYPNVVFPGTVYHPYMQDGYSLKQFLDRNQNVYKNKIYLCGPFKDGDHSLIEQSTPNIVTYYEELPYGLCRRLIRRNIGLPTGNQLITELQRGLGGLTYDELPQYDMNLVSNDSWEYIVYNDQFDRLLHITSYISFYSNKPTENSTGLIQLAKLLWDKILLREHEFNQFNKLTPDLYRSAGVIYGMYSRSMKLISNEYNQSTQLMFDCWQKYLNNSASNAIDNDIYGLVQSRINPYTGQQFTE